MVVVVMSGPEEDLGDVVPAVEVSDEQWEQYMIPATHVFDLVAGDDQLLSKEELVEACTRYLASMTVMKSACCVHVRLAQAHRGDFKLFEKLDVDEDGKVTKEEWERWLRTTHAKKSKGGDTSKGEKWMNQA